MRNVPPVFALAALGLAAPTAPARAAPAWTPDPAQAGRLAPPARVTTFQVRPPSGYTERTMKAGGETLYAWVGPPHAPGVRPYVMFGRVVPPAKDRDKYTLSQALTKFMAPIARQHAGYAASPLESGTISGVPFVRTHWSGADARTGLKMRGFNYLGRRGGEFFLLGSQDAADAKSALALAEASCLTFRPE